MYNWNIRPGNYNWRFSIKSSDRTLADRIPILEFNVRYNQETNTLYYGEDAYVINGMRTGEINICHHVSDTNIEYAEHMYGENLPSFFMELHPNLRTERVHVFTELRLRSMNYSYSMSEIGIIETQWNFLQSSVVVNGEMIEGESPLVSNDIMHQPVMTHNRIGSSSWQLINQISDLDLNIWSNNLPLPKTEQKLDWREYGF